MKPDECKVGMRVAVKLGGGGGLIVCESSSMFLVRYHGQEDDCQWHVAGMLDPVPDPDQILNATFDAFAKAETP